MASERQENQSAAANGPEQRAYERYPVRFKVRLTSAALQDCTCIAENFSAGGLFLSCGTGPEGRRAPDMDGLLINDSVEIACMVPGSGGTQVLSFKGQVVRRAHGAVAVRFVNPDLSALQLLLEHVKTINADSLSPPTIDANFQGRSPAINGKTAQELLAACSATVDTILDSLMVRFSEAVADSLFTAAQRATNIAEQSAFLDGLKILDTKGDCARTSFCNAVRNDLAQRHLRTVTGLQQGERERSSDDLAIVEDEYFDEWLAEKDMVSSIESHCKQPLAELTQRLSVVCGREISNENDPYGPALFSRSFREAMRPLGLAHIVNLACYQVFKSVLVKELGALYTKLNRQLVAGGILPVISYRAEKQPAAAASDANSTPPAVERTAPDEVAGTGQAETPARAQALAPDIAPDIVELLGRLRRLQQNVAAPGGPRPSAACAHAAPQPAGVANLPAGDVTVSPDPQPVYYSPKDLISALEQLNPTGSSENISAHARDYKSEVLTVLAGNRNGAGGNDIGVREGTIMDVAGSIFHALATDIQVSDSVRGWIQRLELPILKMALLDDSLFRDKSHPLRQVINKLSQLEVLSDGAGEANEAATRNAIEWIVGLFNTEFDGSSDVFLKAIRGLDLLLKAQNKAYFDNLRKVVAEAKQQERDPGLHPERLEATGKVDWGDTDEVERARWLKRVQGVAAGSWIVFRADAGKPRRSRIAWISSSTQNLLLVNPGGTKDRDISAEELAKALHEGSAAILEGTDEPAMDRAQYAMLQDLHSELLHQSTHDQLTGLISRREFEQRLSNAQLSAKYENSQHAVCFIDLDHFSVVNNACGYEGGDQLLQDVASLLNKDMDGNGVLARVGNDEFGMLLENRTLDEAMDFVRRRWQDIQDYRLTWKDKKLSIGASIGLVPVTQGGEQMENLLQVAESGCGTAKDTGGNRIQVFHSGHADLPRRDKVSQWAMEVDRILDDEALYLRCQRIQPILGGGTQPSHFEVLLGVRGADGRDLSTPEFIEAAERYHRMPEVDRWVIRTAFRWIAENQDGLHQVDGFSINLSGRSLNDAGLLQFIMEEMETTGVPTHKLCFEVTETVGVASLSETADFIREIKKAGCKFSLDDFGSGMSSYAYLRHLPVDFLKIDGAFVKDMANNPFDAAVVKSICEIGHFMDKKVIAEYVENDAILEQLRALGVDCAQGYGIEKPIAMRDLTSLLSSNHKH